MQQGSLRNRLADEVARVVGDERRRAVVAGLSGIDADADFDRLTKLAASSLGAPMALLALVDADGHRAKAEVGPAGAAIGFAPLAHAVAAGTGAFVVEDLAADGRFAGDAGTARFLAAAPVTVAGVAVGVLAVADDAPRPRPDAQALDRLSSLAALAASFFSLKDSMRDGVLARAELAREETRRVIALEAASLASWAWDVPAGIVECDALMAVQFNLPPTQRLRARDVFRAIDRRDVNQTETQFRETLATGDDYFGEYRVRETDPPRWLATRGRVIERDADGKPLLVFGVSYEITERKLAEERQRLLLRELNHRVKNTLATVQALATQTVRHAREPSAFLEAFTGRLQALGLAHGLLSDREWRGIGVAELVRREIKAFDDGATPRIALSGPDLLLTPDQALGLGLVLHELASNALKYGSLSVPAGRVDLRWHVEGRDEQRRLRMNWKESGGPTVVPPDRHGFGSILIRRSLAKVLSSEVTHDFAPDGVAAEIVLPLEAAAQD